MSRRLPIAALVAAGGLAALAPAASADVGGDQIITGTGTSSLSISVPSTVTGGILTPGQTTTFAPSAVALVTPSGSWSLSVADGTGNGGKLAAAAAGCTGSEATSTNQLGFSSTAVLAGGSGGTGTLGSSGSTVATGTSLANTVNVTWSLLVGAAEQIKAGCLYSTTATYTLS